MATHKGRILLPYSADLHEAIIRVSPSIQFFKEKNGRWASDTSMIEMENANFPTSSSKTCRDRTVDEGSAGSSESPSPMSLAGNCRIKQNLLSFRRSTTKDAYWAAMKDGCWAVLYGLACWLQLARDNPVGKITLPANSEKYFQKLQNMSFKI